MEMRSGSSNGSATRELQYKTNRDLSILKEGRGSGVEGKHRGVALEERAIRSVAFSVPLSSGVFLFHNDLLYCFGLIVVVLNAA
jgi:hypothetical protein